MRQILHFLILFACCLGNSMNLWGQADGSNDASFNVGDNYSAFDMTVCSIAIQPNGKVLVGGDFTSFNGIPRLGIARLNEDGSLDTGFNTGTEFKNSVNSIALQPDGKVIVGGVFNRGIVRLNADGSLDTGFSSGAGFNGTVNSIALQPDGKVIVGGSFNTFKGVSCSNAIARLNADGSLDTGFDTGTGFSNIVLSLALQPNGKVLVGGRFTMFNGSPCNFVARLNADGSLDNGFNPGIGIGGFFSLTYVYSIALQPDGKVIIAGSYFNFNGLTIGGIVRLNADGSLDTGFSSGAGFNNTVYSIVLQPDGKPIVSGNFSTYNGTPTKRVARLNADGTLDTGFNRGTGIYIGFALALQSDGKVIVGGGFDNYNGTVRNGILRLNTDGSLDRSIYSVTGGGYLASLALQPDGKVIIGGSFTTPDGKRRNSITRLNSDGSLDQTFNLVPELSGSIVNSLALQPDGKVILGGKIIITNHNSKSESPVVRLNADGSFDVSFNAGIGFDGSVYSLALQLDGKIILGGDFFCACTKVYNNIVRLNADGSLDLSFNVGTGFYGIVHSMTLQPDGKVIVGGQFHAYNGTLRSGIARLNADGSLDNNFKLATGFNSTIKSLALQPNGKLIIGGQLKFTFLGSTEYYLIARLNADGSLDSDFHLEADFGALIYSLVLQPDGKVIVGGDYFTPFNGVPRGNILRLNKDGRLDNSFNPGTGFNRSVSSLALQPNGRVLVIGGFNSFDQKVRHSIARLFASNDVVTQNTIDLSLNDPQNNVVFPNPTTSEINWAAPNRSGQKYSYMFYNLQGQLLLSGQGVVTDELLQWDLSVLPAGTYTFRLQVGNENYHQTVVKQ